MKDSYESIRENEREMFDIEKRQREELKPYRQEKEKVIAIAYMAFCMNVSPEDYVEVLIREKHPKTAKGSRLYDRCMSSIRNDMTFSYVRGTGDSYAEHFSHELYNRIIDRFPEYEGKKYDPFWQLVDKSGFNGMLNAYQAGVGLEDIIAGGVSDGE